MGCCNVSTEPWNRLHLPRPAIQCQVTVPLGEHTGTQLRNLVKSCQEVQALLKGKELKVEVSTLDSVLYVYHNSLAYHKPYLALKQVRQCIKRSCSMGLEDSIQEVFDLCPKDTEVDTADCCSVPSQPIIELASMKILGACKLLLRLMDCCCKAFHLCLQHLYLQEFIVLNVVLLGLLSRLWVMYRGILKRLISLYRVQLTVQLEVSAFQKMSYFRDFEFPSSIEDCFGPVFSDLFNKKLPKMFSKKGSSQLLNKIFKASYQNTESNEKISPRTKALKEARGTFVDLGQQIQRQNRDQLEKFDVKSLCHSEANRLQVLDSHTQSAKPNRKQTALSSNERQCIEHILPRIKESASFRELSDQLLYAVKWCKERKLRKEVLYFRYKYLHCRRLQYAEALGQSLTKKLRSWKKSMCHSLGDLPSGFAHKKTSLRMQRCHLSLKHKVTYSRRQKLHKCHTARSVSQVKRKDLKRLCLELFASDQEVSPVAKDTVFRPQTSKLLVSSASTEGANRSITEADDIDDIFSSIGI
ncbi:nucleolus and neural progenitor protein [Hyperolius riggenbachi]|uniref:nucleolus and neural progenitor protein n=1 Tax=Hyperolius riggenbachi TaxID=752182 RepID=UPI0035A37172